MIEFENAGFAYGRAEVLREINLEVKPGSFRVVVGPSGSGKSTLLRLASLDLFATAGRVRHFGRSVRPRNRRAIADLRRQIGVLPQESPFLDHLPLIDNIALPLLVGGIDMRARAGDLQALLDWVDLAGCAGLRPRELSSGERQRAALARAVILSPEVLLADEPAARLDEAAALRVLTLLIELNRMGKAVVLATHDPRLAHWVAAQVAVGVTEIAGGRTRALELAA